MTETSPRRRGHHARLWALVALVAGCLAAPESGATNAVPFAAERLEIDRLRDEAAAAPSVSRSSAFASLKAIAENQAQDASVRSYAIERMGDFALEELRAYLLEIASNAAAIDDRRELRWPAYLAYWRVRMNRAASRAEQREILDEALEARFEGFVASNVQTWAVDELCDRGASDAFPDIIRSIESRDPFERGRRELRLCEAKLEVLTRYARRIDALVSVLEATEPFENMRLQEWAIDELGEDPSDEASALLTRRAGELQAMEATHGEARELRERIAAHLRRRGARPATDMRP